MCPRYVTLKLRILTTCLEIVLELPIFGELQRRGEICFFSLPSIILDWLFGFIKNNP
jgi:hypothetical protein